MGALLPVLVPEQTVRSQTYKFVVKVVLHVERAAVPKLLLQNVGPGQGVLAAYWNAQRRYADPAERSGRARSQNVDLDGGRPFWRVA